MRCLCLSQALTSLGARCVFWTNVFGAGLIKRFGGQATEVALNPLAALLASGSFDALVVDDYQWSSLKENDVRPLVKTLAVIDDLADRPHLADLLIDPGYGRAATAYHGYLPQNALVLTGPAFAFVRPAFAKLRADVLAQPIKTTPERLFMSFGLSDIGGVAARAARLVRLRHPTLPIDVAIASDAQSTATLRAQARCDPNLHVHEDADQIEKLIASSDVVVGAGGASTWERCCLGAPTLAVIVADNQRPMIQAMMKDNVLLGADLGDDQFDEVFIQALSNLWRPEVRTELRVRSVDLCDGLGAQRVARAILGV